MIRGSSMNADILRRVVRAIAEGSLADLDRLAPKMVEAERKSGHARLADQLDSILKQPKKRTNGHAHANGGMTTDSDRSIRELPLSRRHCESLATLLPPEALEHHMVLSSATEECNGPQKLDTKMAFS